MLKKSLIKQPIILFYIAESEPDLGELIEIKELGFDVKLRNSRYADAFEDCVGVIFSTKVPEDRLVRKIYAKVISPKLQTLVPDGRIAYKKHQQTVSMQNAELVDELKRNKFEFENADAAAKEKAEKDAEQARAKALLAGLSPEQILEASKVAGDVKKKWNEKPLETK